MAGITNALKFASVTTIGAIATLAFGTQAFANDGTNAEGPAGSAGDAVAKFRQLDHLLPSPNIYRSASGAPGPGYWQQRASHTMDIRLDEDERRIFAESDIDYTNNSPDPLNYIWLALDQNRFKDGSLERRSATASAVGSRRGDGAGGDDRYSFFALRKEQAFEDRQYGFEFQAIMDEDGKALPYVINDSMMRIDLPEPLETGESITIQVDWEHNILDEVSIGGRGGYEYFEEDDNYIFGMAQWFPRLAAYTDYTGWQNKQFLGRGEFTLEFGDYDVNLTVPSDHIVSATGELTNPRDVLTAKQRQRLENAGTEEPIYIVTPDEAAENEKSKARGTKTWKFSADNVRDFAWSSSRKYIWDAMKFEQDDAEHPEVLAMSFFPKEADPIWSKYSTQAVVHTMEVYNKFAFNYPYPTAQSVNTWERGGMEYPMITFNGYRPSEDEKSGEVVYSRNIKYGLIGVIIHEVGHIYFPMVVNSDERRYTWMDEGLNSFLEYMAEYEWEEDFPISRGMQNPLDVIPSYMTSSNQVPIMTQSDSVLQFGPNAYSKPAASLIVLRETVMGRELFDFAFREYANRWKFKRPTPADFFRTMEDASAVDLDWFWRGWYYGTDHVDMALTSVREYQISTNDPDIEKDIKREEDALNRPENITQRRNRDEGITPRLKRYSDLEDFYNENDKFTVTNADRNKFKKFYDGLEDWERAAYDRAMDDGKYLYFVDFENIGGLISPLPVTIRYENGTSEEQMIPAEIWRRNAKNVTKLFVLDSRAVGFELDVAHQTADADFSNNAYPQRISQSRIDLYKSSSSSSSMMADMLRELHSEESDEAESNSKSVPMGDAKSKDDSEDATEKQTDDISEDEDEAEDKKSTLRKTLERMLERR
ncbi:aminopeptidase [Litorimonas cladophorae]|uniref:Aminopeptidase n=1 Tax=Litorimonas cladophorae TaxID=1220491 RepID=A0A918KCJ3_9PROT|nr:M1 family metallopeptidase [Litorimonas cladophorae]GGX58640.1 aminopeptidase [Litorimonas cladophorae]